MRLNTRAVFKRLIWLSVSFKTHHQKIEEGVPVSRGKVMLRKKLLWALQFAKADGGVRLRQHDEPLRTYWEATSHPLISKGLTISRSHKEKPWAPDSVFLCRGAQLWSVSYKHAEACEGAKATSRGN